jgi:hypothetical protein
MQQLISHLQSKMIRLEHRSRTFWCKRIIGASSLQMQLPTATVKTTTGVPMTISAELSRVKEPIKTKNTKSWGAAAKSSKLTPTTSLSVW